MSDYVERTKQGQVFIGSDMDIFAMLTLASALKMYAETKMKASRFHTPTAMLKRASEYTGLTYKRGQFLKAAQDLTDDADRLKRFAPCGLTRAASSGPWGVLVSWPLCPT